VLLGDYHGGMVAVSALQLFGSAFFWRVPPCAVTLFYLVGFSYMMLRRYEDAIRVCSHILTFVSKTRTQLSSQSYQCDAITKMGDRMGVLVMMSARLSSSKVDESLTLELRELCPDKFLKIQSDDEGTYQEGFLKACPKYIDASSESREEADEAKMRQLNVFLQDVRRQQKVNAVRSFAKLYNNISLQKLLSLMDVPQSSSTPTASQTVLSSNVEDVRADVMTVKSMSRQRIWKSGQLLSGVLSETLTGTDFHVENDLVCVQSSNPDIKYSSYFLEQMGRTQEMLGQLQGTEAV